MDVLFVGKDVDKFVEYVPLVVYGFCFNPVRCFSPRANAIGFFRSHVKLGYIFMNALCISKVFAKLKVGEREPVSGDSFFISI